MLQERSQGAQQSILIVDDDEGFLDSIRHALLANGCRSISTLQDSSHLLRVLAGGDYSVILLDWVMPDPSGADLLPEILRTYPEIPVIVISGVSDLDNVVSCIRQGAYDYITKPLDTNRLISVVTKAIQKSQLLMRNRRLTDYLLGEPLANPENFSDFVTCSDKMLAIFKVIETLAASREPVLITGETGVGKELIARAIHRSSGLDGEMVSVNVAGLDDTMFSDALFGHKKGAFTGATESRAGFVERAKNSTLFLDEIGDLVTTSQLKLLRLLQQNEFHRLGSDVLQKCEARIIAASNVPFESLLAAKQFRSDLYYRISVHKLHIPPLRERREDILPLAEHFLAKLSAAAGSAPPDLSREVRQALLSYDFPGNVREMINLLQSALAGQRNGMLQLCDFPVLLAAPPERCEALRRIGSSQYALNAFFQGFPTLAEIEELLLVEAMAQAKNNKSVVARMLGISRPTLHKKLEMLAEKQLVTAE